MRRIVSFVALAGLLLSTTLLAHFELISDLDARGIGMGGTLTVVGDDANAVSGNPAALGFVDTFTFSLMGNPMNLGLDDGTFMTEGQLNGAFSFGAGGTAGLAVNYFMSTGPQGTADTTGLTFSAFQSTIGYGLAIPGFEDLCVGVGARVQGWNIPAAAMADVSGEGLGNVTFNANVGVLYNFYALLGYDIGVGISARNLLGLANSAEENIPAGTLAGIDRTVSLAAAFIEPGIGLTVGLNTDFNIGMTSLDVALGGEYRMPFVEGLAARLGFGLKGLILSTPTFGVTVGVGYMLPFGLGIDAAYEYNIGMMTGGNVALSVSYTMDSPFVDYGGAVEEEEVYEYEEYEYEEETE